MLFNSMQKFWSMTLDPKQSTLYSFLYLTSVHERVIIVTQYTGYKFDPWPYDRFSLILGVTIIVNRICKPGSNSE